LLAFWLIAKGKKKVGVDSEDYNGEVVSANEQILVCATSGISIAKHDGGGKDH